MRDSLKLSRAAVLSQKSTALSFRTSLGRILSTSASSLVRVSPVRVIIQSPGSRRKTSAKALSAVSATTHSWRSRPLVADTRYIP